MMIRSLPYIAVAVLVAAILGAVYHRGYDSARVACHRQQLEAAMAFDKRLADEAIKYEQARRALFDAEQNLLDEVSHAVKANPAIADCRLGDRWVQQYNAMASHD